MWDDYTVPGGTYRENLLNTPGESLAPVGHPAREYRYENLKAKWGDENGDITINKENVKEEVKEKVNGEVKEKESIVPVVENVFEAPKEVVVTA